MRNERSVQVQAKHQKKFQKGYPLIFKEAIVNAESLKEEGEILG